MLALLDRDIFNRTFSLSEFLSNHRHELIPAGLCLFQAAWDEMVTRTFRETLGTKFTITEKNIGPFQFKFLFFLKAVLSS